MKNIDLLAINFEKFIQNNKNIFIGKNIAIAISGGADSLALAILANKYKYKYNYKLIAFSIDHQLRSEAAKEVRICKKFDENYRYQTSYFSVDSSKTQD